ncbi:hypothetical protein ACPBEH_02550 [Latilactobacillus sp. 5-91]|uniref:hypothetical protein n=1 Tax=Latilactobacillus sp. 5-91 TaxID=3410924 RepID=UPI003C77A4D1
MTNIKCPWCGHTNEYELWELAPGARFEDEQCPDCGKCFGYDVVLVEEWFADNIKRVGK